MTTPTKETIEKATELGLPVDKQISHHFCTDNWCRQHKEEYNLFSMEKNENTLGNLRKFIEKFKHLPDETPVVEWGERGFKSIALIETGSKTQEELEEAIKEKETFMIKHEKWERVQYEILKKKFGGK